MAATFNESQKIDYLWKKVGYGVTKTAEVTSKEAFNESIASPLLYRGDLVWMQSDQITGTPPASTTSIIQVYKDGVGSYSPSVECTEDLTAPDNQTWKTNLTNWVPTQFGDNYLIQVYVANSGVTNPQTSGTKLFQAGSGTDDTWFFDYQSGVLNFNGANIPAQITGGITGKSVYIVGYRYVGLIGVTNQPSGNISSNTNIGNLNFTDTTISTITTNSNIYLTPNGVGNIHITTSVTASGNIVANTGAFFIGDGGYLANLNTSGVANGNSNVQIPTSNGNINLTAVGNTTLIVTDTGANVFGYLTVTGNLTANNISSNVSSDVVTSNSANISGNLYVGDTATIGNVRTDNILYANGQPWDLQEAAGSNTQIQYNDGSTNFGASANFTYNDSTQLLTVTGNVFVADTANIGNVRTDNLLYANGSPWDLQEAAGLLNQIQYNADNGDFGASANLTYNDTTQLLTVAGNIGVSNASLGNLASANYINVLANLSVADTANVGVLRTDYLLYANGQPWDLQEAAGANTYIQFNDGNNNFGASANFTYNDSTQLLTVVGNANVTNFNASGTLSVIGNISAGNANLGNLTTSNYFHGIFDNTSSSQPNITSLGNLTSLTVGNSTSNVVLLDGNITATGNINANNVSGNFTGTFTGNVNGNITGIGSNTQVLFNYDGDVNGSNAFTFDYVGNILTLTGTGNITGNLNVSSNVTAANGVFGNISTTGVAGDITGVNSISTVTLIASGNISAANANISSNLYVINTANVGNLRTDNLLYANGSPWDMGGVPGGSNTQIQFNDSNEFGGSANFTFDKTTNLLTVSGNGIFGNISTAGPSGDITGANVISTVTLTASGNITAANANLGNTSIANNVVANTFRMGVGVNEFYHSTVYFATTTSTDPNQVLWSTSMANLSAIDFTIISTDETSNTRQTAKIAAAVLGTEVVFNEYSGLYINGGVGSFSVNYQAGTPDTVQLVVTPDSINLTKYNMMIIQYAK